MADADRCGVIADRIEAVLRGEPTVDVLVAIAMVLGAFEAKAKKPNFDALMALVSKTARWQFDQTTNGGSDGEGQQSRTRTQQRRRAHAV
mgnify:CR=1 FL=1